MASMANSFDLLNDVESKLSTKKKKQNKQAAAQSDNGSNSVPADTGRASVAGGQVDVYEAVAIIERAAREARSIADKCKLWKDWIRQASERSAKSIKYKDADGTILEFRQLLLKSRALEISLEGAVGAGMTVEREDLLSQLLQAFSSRSDPRTAQSLASAIVRLSTLTEDEPLDVKGAAQRAVYAVVSSVKAASSDAVTGAEAAAMNLWTERVNGLEQTIARERGMLQKLAAAGRGATTKEHAETARKIFRLTGDQFDLLQSESIPNVGSNGADSYMPALDSLRSAISGRIQAAMGDKPKGGKGGDTASKQAALASLRKEEAIVSQQVDSVAGQIRTLEAQLRSLRSQQQELDDKRTQLQQRMRLANDPSAQGKKGAAGVAHHQEELLAVNAIHDILLATDARGTGADQALAAQAHSQSVGSDFVVAGRQYLEIARAAMSEVPSKVTFCKQRLAQAEKLLKLGSKEGNRVQADAEKLMAETVKSADDLLRSSVEVDSDLKGRINAILRSQSDADSGLAEAMHVVDQLLRDIQAQYDAVQVMLRPPAPIAPPPVPVAAPAAVPYSNGKHQPAPARPVSAAPGPAPARPVSAAPAPIPAPARPVSAAAAPAAVSVAPLQPALAPYQPVAAPDPGPQNAFDAAAAYLAGPRAPIRSESPVAAPARKAAPVAAPAVARPAPSSAPRQWGKPAAMAAPAVEEGTSGDDSLPTPAEAMAAAAAKGPALASLPVASDSAGGEEEGKAKKKKSNRPKA